MFGSEYLQSGELQTEGDRLVSRLNWTANTLQENKIQCLPGLGEAQASITINVLEDYEYTEEEKDYEYSGENYEYTEEEEEDYEYSEEDYEYRDVTPSEREEIKLTEAPGDATRPDLAHHQLPHDSEPSEVLEATAPGLRTITSSGRESRAVSSLVLVTVLLLRL